MRPICIKCQRFFRCKKNDYWFTEGARPSFSVMPGNAEPEKWFPYKVWAGDLYECPECKTQIISGFAREPLSESYKPDFEDLRKSLGADQFQVNG